MDDYDKDMATCQDDDFLADQAEFRRKLEERMLQNELIDDLIVDNFSTKRESVMTETDIREGLQEWSKDYDHHINNPPKEGDILSAMGQDAEVLLTVELVEDHSPFIYGLAFVPEIVGAPLGWYLRGTDNGKSYHGWKCIILPRARTELIRKFGLQNETMQVKSLRVVRPSQSGKALLCEVHKYGDEEPEVQKSEVEAQEEVGVSAIKTDPAIAHNLHQILLAEVQEVVQDQETKDSLTADTERATPEVSIKS